MEQLANYAQIISTFGPGISALLLVVLLFERAVDRGWIRIGKNNYSFEGKVLQLMETISNSQGELRAHYNDDTTRLLAEISMKLDQLPSIREGQTVGFTAMAQKFNEWEKYGIPSRPVK